MSKIIIRPIISEKSMQLVENDTFTFEVALKAAKDEIKKAIESVFEVHVVSVTTSVVKGKTHRSGPRRIERVQSSWKKAMVTLKKGEKIGLFDLK